MNKAKYIILCDNIATRRTL